MNHMKPASRNTNKSILHQAVANKQRNELPAFFTQRMMQHIRYEAVRKEKKHERLLFFWIVAISIGLIGMVVGLFYYFSISLPSLDFGKMINENKQTVLFWLFIASGVVAMLCIDFKLRQRWNKEESQE